MKRSYRSYEYHGQDHGRKEELRRLRSENASLKAQIQKLQHKVNALKVKEAVEKIFN